jgi:hypothetical protein
MTFPYIMESHNPFMFQTTNQVFISCLNYEYEMVPVFRNWSFPELLTHFPWVQKSLPSLDQPGFLKAKEPEMY